MAEFYGQTKVFSGRSLTQESPGEIKGREVELDFQESPGEIKSGEVELDSPENPGEIKSREVELDSPENPGQIKNREEELDSHSRTDCLAAELFLNSGFSDTVFVTLLRTAVERAISEVHKSLRNGWVPTSLTLFWRWLTVSSVFSGRSSWTKY